MIKLASRTAVIGAVAVLGIAVSGCASHRFVRDQDAIVNSRVDGVEQRVGQVEGTAGEALRRATAAQQLLENKFLYEVVLSDDSVKFPVEGDTLSPEAEARLRELVQRLKAENRNVYLEIQGHTDSTGNDQINERLGQERAEAVRRFLSDQGIALNRMATISYGAAKPVAPNNTRDGRAQNRRVAIMVLA